MKTFINALCVVVTFVAVAFAAAADKPNFSGEWKMNAAKSNFSGLPAPSSIVRKVTHTEPALAIVEEQQGDMGTQNTTRKYTTDGQPASFEANGAQVVGSAVWEGSVLVVSSTVEGIGVKFVDRMSLSEDGRTMTSAVHVALPQGEIDLSIVFEKQ
jgi:hypothetical protein